MLTWHPRQGVCKRRSHGALWRCWRGRWEASRAVTSWSWSRSGASARRICSPERSFLVSALNSAPHPLAARPRRGSFWPHRGSRARTATRRAKRLNPPMATRWSTPRLRQRGPPSMPATPSPPTASTRLQILPLEASPTRMTPMQLVTVKLRWTSASHSPCPLHVSSAFPSTSLGRATCKRPCSLHSPCRTTSRLRMTCCCIGSPCI
mmetsp:Transcript_563/g.1299  ORF Transcript_563/g.1299 Transcript_563/m.1299 type:complete len:207 (-) Transcript_563:451-1071(-)